ncbi:hypothetical protein BSR29_03455 [Boudabousia liubingyangii]|uniref:Uncharacterized protein n=1 Tax=Boudabousia liubingyangii TaxID=1921764 RepID=A0A1Q5PMX8_9ACTO|nr:hypothetical protein [Boudabousia liubingyangii]OKL48911.1 hypothetical protein BSR29_03455 [Boudabousia liubingyangii]
MVSFFKSRKNADTQKQNDPTQVKLPDWFNKDFLKQELADHFAGDEVALKVSTPTGVVLNNRFGIHLLGESGLLESVPWVAVSHLRFDGKQRLLTISFSRIDADPVELRVAATDPQEFMEAAKEHLDHSIVLVRSKKTESGVTLRGTVRRDHEGEMLVLINAVTAGPVAQSEVDDFEGELREMLDL